MADESENRKIIHGRCHRAARTLYHDQQCSSCPFFVAFASFNVIDDDENGNDEGEHVRPALKWMLSIHRPFERFHRPLTIMSNNNEIANVETFT